MANRIPLAAAALFAAGLAACATAPQQTPAEAGYDVSEAAFASVRRSPDGAPLGLDAYSGAAEALRAGDTAAFVALAKAGGLEGEGGDAFTPVVRAMDAAATGDTAGARAAVSALEEDAPFAETGAFIDAWLYALDAQDDAAVDAMREIGGALPGLTGDLALAAMLEGFERHDEALALYAQLTPARIEAPEHQFDPRGILFNHVQTVVARRTLLLRRLGRVEEAKAVYAKLAEAEPEEAVRYAAAIASLDDAANFDDEFLTPRSAFARSFADLSLALYQRRVIMAAALGARLTGFDQRRAAMDQLALMFHPEDETLREVVVDGLFDEALYEGAAHVADAAPERTPRLLLSAASSRLMLGDEAGARERVEAAVAEADADERLETLAGALRLTTLLGDEDRAVALANAVRAASENPSERAVGHSLTAVALQHFGRAGEAVAHARSARQLDDTHDRRMALADTLAEAGEVDEALRLIRTERLGRPNDPYMLNTLGYFLITRTDRIDEGYRVLARAYALADRDPYIADSFGWARFQFGDLEGALRLIEQAKAELAPKSHWEIEDHLGDIYWLLDRREEASAAWTRALEEFPPKRRRAEIETKLADGYAGEAPETRPLPQITRDDPEVSQQDI